MRREKTQQRVSGRKALSPRPAERFQKLKRILLAHYRQHRRRKPPEVVRIGVSWAVSQQWGKGTN